MADFCLEATKEMFGVDGSDFEGVCKEGQTVEVLCEHHGWEVVDHMGRRVADQTVQPDLEQRIAVKGTGISVGSDGVRHDEVRY